MRALFSTSLLIFALLIAMPAIATTSVMIDDAPTPVVLSQQAKTDLTRVEEYFKNLATVKAQFVQDAQQFDGSHNQVSGSFKLSRPGKLRIDYADPIKDFIVADGNFIYMWDAAMKQQSQTAIENTLAGFILRRDVRFSGDDITVTKVDYPTPTKVEVTVRSAKDPTAGELTLLLDDVPLKLTGWRVLDAQGLITTVTLSTIETGITLPREDFIFKKPTF